MGIPQQKSIISEDCMYSTVTYEVSAWFVVNNSYRGFVLVCVLFFFSLPYCVISLWGSSIKQRYRKNNRDKSRYCQLMQLMRTAVQLTWRWIWGSIYVRKIYKGGSELQQLEIHFDYALINFLGRGWDTIILLKCAKAFFVLFWSFQSCILAKTLESSVTNFRSLFIWRPNSNPKCDICSPPTKLFMKSLTVLLMLFSVDLGAW